jgi:PAS domain S-box-containing protein
MSQNQLPRGFEQHLELHFRCLAENVPQIFSFIDPETYAIKFINRVEEGYELKEVIGKEIFNYLLPDQVEAYRSKIEEVKSTGRASRIETGFQSFTGPSGISWFLTTISPVYDPSGKLESILILSEDVSESKLLEIENQNRSERLKAIINNNEDMICSIDTDYNLIEFNTVLEKIVKNSYRIDLEPGMPILNFLNPAKHEHLKAIYEKVKQGEIFHDIEAYTTTTQGMMYLETSFHPIFGINDEVTGISIFSKNITERVKNEQKIKEALREKEILLAEIHHRIKNNLAMISSMLQLQELTITNTELREALASSRKRIKTTALIHEMLYRNETFNKISLKDFIRELYALLRTSDQFELDLQGEDLVFNLSTALPLGLIMNEILINSFKHSYIGKDQGKTTITIRAEGDDLNISYCDCQGSFPKNVDFKNSNTTGLTLIHTFAEQLSGSIDLVSNEPPMYQINIRIHENH